MNGSTAGIVPVPLRWLRGGWVILMTAMVITLALGLWTILRHFQDTYTAGQEEVTVLNYAVNLVVLLMLLFVMVASTIIFWKAERQTTGILLALTLLIYWTTDSTPFDILTKPEFTSLYALFRAPILILRASALPLTLALLLTFPDGRFLPKWTRWLLLGYSILTLLYLLFPDFPTNTIYGSTWRRTPMLSFAVAVVPFCIGIYSQVRRYRAAKSDQRNQLKWTVLGMVIMVVGVMLYYGVYVYYDPSSDSIQEPLTIITLELVRQFIQLLLAVILPIVCFMIAIFRYRLWSADPVINRVLVYTAFVGIISLIYFVSITVIGLMFSTINFTVSVPVTIFILLIFQPLRERIQRTVDQLMFGDRANPYVVLTQFDAQVQSGETTDSILGTIAQMLAQTLKVPSVSIALQNSGEKTKVAAVYGRVSESQRLSRFPMQYRQVHVGEIMLYQDIGDRSLSPTERQLVETVARQTALAVHTLELNSALQQSRQHIVAAREEERRRIRRDLHDGLGPTLAAHTLKVGKARRLMAQNPQTAAEILGDLETDLGVSLAEIRRLVAALRPPVLDQLGLVGAVREFIYPINTIGGSDSTLFTLDTPQSLSPLPAAVEVAAYRIITEALTNVIRHACAATCSVVMDENEGALQVTITDDGIGLSDSIRYGVGFNSMRERAEEIGGAIEFIAVEPCGTQIRVRLPLS
jgi:signal transduction histidine kinase